MLKFSLGCISCVAVMGPGTYPLYGQADAYGQVKVYREPLTLPAYGVREPEIMPDWRINRYPYAMLDRLSNTRGERTYNALYVENEYVKALVLPEIGGRLHGALDKTNGYQFLYDQKVIKPGLVGMTGAWISGGVEWNFPRGHRPSGFRETDWRLTEDRDGSRTAWVGEIEKLKGMRWSVGITVHPGRNWIETSVRLENCTPFVQSFQYWATSAVRATPEYQAVIPAEIMTGHGKHEYLHWPVNKGVDLSYWKNTPGASSYFAVDSESDFFGGYSPEENAGMVHFADHYIVRGKKLWTWGTAPAGRIWEKILTDGDLPYFEPQAGAYSDNQPSLFWILPGETKLFSHFWFPVRDIGVYDYANLEGSVNLELTDGKARFGWSPTGVNREARILVFYEGEEIFQVTTDADPAHPFLGEAAASGLEDLCKLKMVVLSSRGDTLLSFHHKKPENPPLPEPEPDPPGPGEVSSQDLLFVYGDRFYRYDDPGRALAYFQEAVRRDPGDVRCNASMGEMALLNGSYDQALEFFNRSIERDKTCFKAWYYKGVTQVRLGDLQEAEKSLNRAAYSEEWSAIAHFELAQLAALQNRLNPALEHINQSIGSNAHYSQAYDVKALILIRMGRFGEAREILREVQTADPLDLFSVQLQLTAAMASGKDEGELEGLKDRLLALTRADDGNHIELAIRFARCGDYADAVQVLGMLSGDPADKAVSPLVYYYQAYYNSLMGKTEDAGNLLNKASAADPEYCFPFRLETVPVLDWALSENPGDALAHYLLGNLMKKCTRTEDAILQWEKSVVLDPTNAVAQRNLGLAYFEQGDLQKAQNDYRAAIQADPSAGRAIVELGRINRELDLPYGEQIRLFEDHLETVREYQEAVTQLILLYALTGRNIEALDLLNTNHFNSWEGKYGIHQLWVHCNIKQGDEAFKSGNYEGALRYYEQSLLYPDNLEVAEQPGTIHARKNYKIGKALEALGKKDRAEETYKLVLADEVTGDDACRYYRARALEALGRKQEAKGIYEQMLDASRKAEDDLQKSVGLYTRALAFEGLGRKKEAEEARSEAFRLNPLVELSAFRPPRGEY